MEHSIQINSTGRFYSSKPISNQIKAVWFVFHGYGMRADEFIKDFDVINDEETLIIAVEGFHRFYKRSTRGEIGANWMTSDLREDDINNIVTYLNRVWEYLIEEGLNPEVRLGVLGFSQGCPAAFRWSALLKRKVDILVAWGSDIPKDVYSDVNKLRKVNESKIQLVVGDSDEYISSDQVDDLIISLHDVGVQYDFHTFNGGHQIDQVLVRYFHARLMDDNLEY